MVYGIREERSAILVRNDLTYQGKTECNAGKKRFAIQGKDRMPMRDDLLYQGRRECNASKGRDTGI